MRNFTTRTRIAALATLAVAAGSLACSNLRENLLEAPDPDIIDPAATQSAAGANAVRLGALARLRLMTVGSGNAGTEGTWLMGGLLADEWSTSSTFVQNDEVDERQTSISNSSVDGSLRAIYRVPTTANQAIQLLNKYRPTPASDIAEMYFARGFAQLQLANDFCNGIPLSSVLGLDITLSSQGQTVSQVFTIAVASFDSAIALANGTDAASVAILRAAKVGKARALLGLDRAADAATEVAGIPTNFTYDVTSSTSSQNGIWNQANSQLRYSVGDSLEANDRKTLVKNALPFFASKDDRLRAAYATANGGKDTTKGQDGLTYARSTPLFAQIANVAVVNGIDARLAEAEAALRANNPASMITILNALRSTAQTLGNITTVPANLPALTDPGTADGRVNLLFRERAFWTFGRGERLGDLRRLIRQYNRTADQVFPVGTHYRGTTYGADVNLPITQNELNGNPGYKGCTDRKA